MNVASTPTVTDGVKSKIATRFQKGVKAAVDAGTITLQQVNRYHVKYSDQITLGESAVIQAIAAK